MPASASYDNEATESCGVSGGLALLGAAAGSAEAGRAGQDCAPVGCVLAADGDFCACRPGGEVCSGQRAVNACAGRVCCFSAATSSCYCTNEAACWSPDDIPTDRCDARLSQTASCQLEAAR